MIPNRISAEYLEQLQYVYHKISNKGILVDGKRLQEAREHVDAQIIACLDIIKAIWKCHVYVGAANDDGSKDSVNLNASSGQRTPLLKLQSLGYVIPKLKKRNEDTGDYESKESLAELALQRMLASNQSNTPGGDPVVKAILKIRELTTLKSRYINTRLYERPCGRYYLSSYNVVGTTTGRRSSKKHVFGFGNNAQNLPSRGREAIVYKRCLIARPGNIFLFVDQMQAEDWPVSALAYNIKALEDLRDGVDRHRKLASLIFNIPENQINDQQRYLGKKTRHARNYGMAGNTMSDSLAAEGISIQPAVCQFMLDSVGKIDPSVKEVFHKYVESELYHTRTLKTPFGRERQFFGLRAGDSSGNQKIFRDAYAFIPQSTVGDNTGFAVFELESPSSNGSGNDYRTIVQEGHDSIAQEVLDRIAIIWNSIQDTIYAFDREIEFHNGIALKIPVEGKIGYDFNTTVTLKNYSTGSKKLSDISMEDLKTSYEELQAIREPDSEIGGDKEYKEMSDEYTDNELESESEETAWELDN